MELKFNKLNAGCGSDARKGYVNLDKFALPGVDIVHDLEKLPLPFDDNKFDEIVCQDVLEHIEYIALMKEFFRLLAPGGVLALRVPHFTAVNNYVDPTHKKMFSFRLFEYFVKGSLYNRAYYFDFSFSKILSSKISLPKNMFFYNYFLEPLININDITRRIYEGTMLSRLFPAENVIVRLQK